MGKEELAKLGRCGRITVMIYYILGILTGVLLTGFMLLFSIVFKNPITRAIKQTESIFKEKGKILEPEDNQLEDWVESIKK